MRTFRRRLPVTVVLDDTGVRRLRGPEVVEDVSWQALASVDIRTTSHGPFVDDLFWLLGDGTGLGVLVPSELAPEGFVQRLQELPGFDSEALTEAALCAEDALFHLWSRVA